MASLTSAQAEVRVVPSLKGFQKTVAAGIGKMRVNPISVAMRPVTDGLVRGARAAFTQVSNLASSAAQGAARAFERYMPRAHAVVSQFARGFRDVDGAIGTTATRLERMGSTTRRALTTAAQPLNNFVAGFRNTNAAASAFTGRMGTLGGVARRAVGGVSSAFVGLGNGIRGVASRISASLNDGIASPLAGMARMASGMVAAVGMGALGTSAIRAAQDMQAARMTLTGLYGDARAAGDMMERIRRLSMDSPIEHAAFAQGAQQLAYMGFEGEQAENILRNVGAAITAVGGSSEGMGRATSAMLGMINSGRVYAAQLNQISDSGIPIWSALSDAMFGTVDRVADVREAVTEGSVSIDQVMKAIEEGSGATFQSMISASDEVSKSFANQWRIAKDNFITTMADMLIPFVDQWGPAIGDFGRTATAALEGIPDQLSSIGSAMESAGVMDALRSMRDMVLDLARGAMPVLRGAAIGIGVAFGGVLIALQPLFDLLAGMGRWLQENERIATNLGIAIGILAGALVTARIVTGALSISVGILNTVMRANPVGLVVTAIMLLVGGLIYAYQNFEGFRNVVDNVWGFLKSVGSWIGSVFGAIWRGLATAFEFVGSVFSWVWNNVLKPVWDAFAAVARFVFTVLVALVIAPLIMAFEELGRIFRWVYDKLLEPMFQAFAAVGRWLWNNMLSPTFDAISAGWRWLSDGFRLVYERYLAPIFDWFGDRVEQFRGYFETLVGRIIGVWETMRDGFKTPINWVIDTVWNRGVGGLWEKAQTILSLDDFVPAQLLATGGPVRGPGSGTSDSIPARLSDGEHVLTAKEVQRAGGHGAVIEWRKSLLAETHPVQRAAGGPVTWQDLWAGISRQFPQARRTSDLRRGDSGYHGRGKAVDVAGPRPMDMPYMLRMNQWAANAWGAGLAELIHTQPGAINLKNGRGHTYSAGVQADHRDHVHIAAGGGGLGSMIGGVISGATSWLADRVRSLYDTVAGPLRTLLESMYPGEHLVHQLPRSMGSTVLDAVRDKLFGEAGAGDGVEGSGPVVDQVRQAAAAFGWDSGAQWNAIDQLVSNESSWNPTAQNPRSTAYGLFQFLDATWGTVGATKTSNPGLQAQAAMRYIQQRYTDPLGAMSFWNRNRWYDNGGWLDPGVTRVVNRTGAPEAVLTPSQWAVASAAIEQVHRGRDLERLGVSQSVDSGPRGPLFGDVHVHKTVDVDAAMNRAAFLAGSL